MRIERLQQFVGRWQAAMRLPPMDALYLRQGRVPAFVLAHDPPSVADELAALRRRRELP